MVARCSRSPGQRRKGGAHKGRPYGLLSEPFAKFGSARAAQRDPPGSAGVPPASLFLMPLAGAELSCGAAGSQPVGGNLNGQTEADPRRSSGSIRVAEMAKAVPDIVRAGRPRSRGHPPHHKPGTWFTSCPGIGRGAWFSAQESLPPLRGSRQDKGEARSRAGGGQTPPSGDHNPSRQ